LTEDARRAADRLGLDFERRYVGYGEMEPAVVALEASGAIRAADGGQS